MCTRKASLPEANRYFLINKYLSVDLFDDAKVIGPNGGDRKMLNNGSFSSCKKSCYIFYALAA